MPDSAPLSPLEIPDYTSPEVDAESRVTVRYFQPRAQTLWLQAEWNDLQPAAMHRDAAGLWSITSQRLKPEIYEYSLFADGVPVADGRNPWARHVFASLVQIRGVGPAAWDLREVPHGSTHTHWYASGATGETRRLHVYTPPGYEEGTERYPVLYLLHGSGDDDASWIQTGRVHWMLDNLIAQGEAVPMIVAMPYGHAGGKVWKEDRARKIALFSADFHEAVIPFVEGRYRTRQEAPNRAMAGLSMGGGQTICAGLTRPDLFKAFGIFSAGLWPEAAPFLRPALGALRACLPSVLWIGIGRRDFLYPRCQELRRELAEAGVPFQYHEDGSSHTWQPWRDYFLRFARLLFRTP